jgi:hypothetical protein
MSLLLVVCLIFASKRDSVLDSFKGNPDLISEELIERVRAFKGEISEGLQIISTLLSGIEKVTEPELCRAYNLLHRLVHIESVYGEENGVWEPRKPLSDDTEVLILLDSVFSKFPAKEKIHITAGFHCETSPVNVQRILGTLKRWTAVILEKLGGSRYPDFRDRIIQRAVHEQSMELKDLLEARSALLPYERNKLYLLVLKICAKSELDAHNLVNRYDMLLTRIPRLRPQSTAFYERQAIEYYEEVKSTTCYGSTVTLMNSKLKKLGMQVSSSHVNSSPGRAPLVIHGTMEDVD